MNRRGMNVLGLALTVAASGAMAGPAGDSGVTISNPEREDRPTPPPRPGERVSARQLVNMRAKNAKRRKRRGW